MDEREEAGEVLESAITAAEEVRTPGGGLRAAASATAMLHAAELRIHELDFDAAVNYLGSAERTVSRALRCGLENAPADANNASAAEAVLHDYLHLITANIASLQGVALYRYAPTQPDLALRTLRSACQENPTQLYLLLCYGEVLSQAGDLVGSLSCFEAAHRLNPRNPLPFVNAARTYQQMSQPSTSERHLQCAVAIDPTFALTHIDVAQGLLHRGAVQEALKTLDYALRLSRHVSDICDVLTAKTVATLQAELQEEGLYAPPPQV
jgi:tetratricopeptide (TPR) repeat protein